MSVSSTEFPMRFPLKLWVSMIGCILITCAANAQDNRKVINDPLTDRSPWPPVAKTPGKVAIILFCPKDVEPPKDYQEGIDRLADYTDKFLLDGIKRWQYLPAVETLFRRKGEHAEVFIVMGKKQASAYTDPSFHKEAIDQVINDHKLEPKSHIWWVLGFKGPPPLRFDGFRGGRSPTYGGWAVANYDSRLSKLQLGKPIGSERLREMALKGMIHELGHAFRLPHIGPRYELKRGNTLMGPTHANFRRVTRRFATEGYLSQASAAMLVAHPVFRGRPLIDRPTPRLFLSEQKVFTNQKSKSVTVSGRIRSNPRPVFAIVADHAEKLPGEYWRRHYVSAVEATGRFEVQVSEPLPVSGKYWLWFVFPNGELTGNGRSQGTGPRGAKQIPYQYNEGNWMLTDDR